MAVQTRFPDLGPRDYWGLLLRKLPRGLMWAQQAITTGATYADGLPVPLTRFSRFLMGLSDELARVHNHWNDLVDEAFPLTATETINEWERDYGLPEFGYVPTLLADRQATVNGKVAATGGASGDYFETLADSYGCPTVATSDGPFPNWWTAYMPDDCIRACCTSSCDAALVEFTTPAGSRVAHAFTAYKPASKPIFWDGEVAP